MIFRLSAVVALCPVSCVSLAIVFRLKRIEFPDFFEWMFRLFSAFCFFPDFIPRSCFESEFVPLLSVFLPMFGFFRDFFCDATAGGVGI